MTQNSKPPQYRAQILRMWMENPTQRARCWRFSLEDVGSGARNGFADLDALIGYLLDLMDEAPERADNDNQSHNKGEPQ